MRVASKKRFAALWITLSIVSVAAAACGSDEPDLPAANAAEVWDFLQAANYQTDWELWPGTTERFVGQEPHGALHTVYANQVSLDAVDSKAGVLPNGAFVIKDNFTPEGVYDVTTIMYKVDGFDPEHNDWFWAMISAAGEVRAEGRIEGCTACHGAQAANDYIWIGPLR